MFKTKSDNTRTIRQILPNKVSVEGVYPRRRSDWTRSCTATRDASVCGSIPLHPAFRNYGALDVLLREVWTISCIVETIIWMAGRIIIGGRLNLTVSFISSLSSLSCLLLPFATSLPRPYLYHFFSRSLPLSEFCAELPTIIIIALLPIISATQLRNCTSMLLIHFLFGQPAFGGREVVNSVA